MTERYHHDRALQSRRSQAGARAHGRAAARARARDGGHDARGAGADRDGRGPRRRAARPGAGGDQGQPGRVPGRADAGEHGGELRALACARRGRARRARQPARPRVRRAGPLGGARGRQALAHRLARAHHACHGHRGALAGRAAPALALARAALRGAGAERCARARGEDLARMEVEDRAHHVGRVPRGAGAGLAPRLRCRHARPFVCRAARRSARADRAAPAPRFLAPPARAAGRSLSCST